VREVVRGKLGAHFPVERGCVVARELKIDLRAGICGHRLAQVARQLRKVLVGKA
jgi:hypothetical protein